MTLTLSSNTTSSNNQNYQVFSNNDENQANGFQVFAPESSENFGGESSGSVAFGGESAGSVAFDEDSTGSIMASFFSTLSNLSSGSTSFGSSYSTSTSSCSSSGCLGVA